jgi:hypothetical protein
MSRRARGRARQPSLRLPAVGGATAGRRSRAGARRGIALVVVLSILLALLLVATPFVVSMLGHERSSRAYAMDDRAQLNAESARNSIITFLYRTGDAAERDAQRRKLNWVQNSYAWDLPMEFSPHAATGLATGLPEVVPPADQLSGVTVQDEQGKINLSSAPPALVATIRLMARQNGRRLSDLATVHSGRDARWVAPQKIRRIDGNALVVDRPELCAGWLYVSRRGQKPLIVEAAGLNENGAVLTVPPVGPAYADGVVSVESRHPVNLLTAPEEVLVALFDGLTRPARKPEDPPITITTPKAYAIAREIRRWQPVDWEMLRSVLQQMKDLDLTQEEIDLVLAAAVNPQRPGITGGTMPICFVSYDTFLIDAAGAVAPAPGVRTAMRSFREIVRLAPPSVTAWTLESQHDFQRFLGTGGNYPFGNHMMTMPGPARTPLTSLEPIDLAQVELRMTPALDLRGRPRVRQHYPGRPDGLLIEEAGAPVVPWNEVIAADPNRELDARAGGFEMWLRFPNPVPPSARLLDLRETHFSNRLSLEFAGDRLILSVCDAGLPSAYLGALRVAAGVSRVVYPLIPEPDTWYHVGAYWQSGKPAQLALLVNGLASPASRFELEAEGRMLSTTLAAAVDATAGLSPAAPIMAADGVTAMEVGREIVEFDRRTNQWRRGARGTSAAPHPPGARLSVLGYSQRLANASLPGPLGALQVGTLPTGGARVQADFGPQVGVNVETGAVALAMLTADLPPGATSFSVNCLLPAGAEFPREGFLVITSGNFVQWQGIWQEIVKYTACAGSGNTATFSNVQRAQLGTPDMAYAQATHPAGSWVFLYSIKTDANLNYPAEGIVQIGDEWIPVRKHPDDPTYFLGIRAAGLHFPLIRAAFRTVAQPHRAGDKIIPVFATRGNDPNQVSAFAAGRDDRVTIIDSALRRQVVRIHHAATDARLRLQLPPPLTQLYQIDQTFALPVQLVALDDWVPVAYSAADPETRLLKFPSGELPSARWLAGFNPNVAIGEGCLSIDELKIFAGDPDRQPIWTTLPMNPADRGVSLSVPPNLPADGGIVKIGDEYVGYAQASGIFLSRCARGFLRSSAQPHDAERVMNLGRMLPVTALVAGTTATADVIKISQRMAANPEGYVLIDDEVIGYTRLTDQELLMPRSSQGTGLYRGRFGTTPAGHGADALAYAIPFRVWDTYAPGEFDNTMAYFQAGTTIPGATWATFGFEPATTPGVPPPAQPTIHALVKVGERGTWEDPPNDPRGRLFDLTQPNVDHSLRGLGGDSLSVRFVFEYPKGAYHPSPIWTRDARVRRVVARYQAVTQILLHEEGR